MHYFLFEKSKGEENGGKFHPKPLGYDERNVQLKMEVSLKDIEE